MRRIRKLCYFILAASSLLFLQCTNEYTAIHGTDGTNGLDGLDGLDGQDANAAACISCHSSSHRQPIIDSYIASGHGSGGSWARGTSTSCAQCHNNEGFIDYLSGDFYKINTDGDPNEYLLDDAGEPIVNDNGTPGDPSDDFYEPNPDYNPDYGDYAEHPVTGELMPSVNPDGYAVSNPISCTGCHTDHRSFDFDTDGNDYAVRNIDAVHLDLDPTISIDFSTSSADQLGLSNLCITCHQPRTSYPIPSGIADVTITSKRYGPHHGPQATMLEGVLGANIAGSTGYPGVGAATHNTGSSCISCHMGETTGGTDGGHTWAPTLNACITCHDSMTSIPEAISGFDTDFETLENLLIAAGYISEAGYVQGDNGGDASGSNPRVVPVAHAQAIWNYKTVAEDNSNGIHNPDYTRALLKNSIEALQN